MPLVLLGACGGIFVDGNLPNSVPVITSFTAAPYMLDAGGGESVLAWTVLYADNLFLAPDAGNITGLTGGPNLKKPLRAARLRCRPPNHPLLDGRRFCPHRATDG